MKSSSFRFLKVAQFSTALTTITLHFTLLAQSSSIYRASSSLISLIRLLRNFFFFFFSLVGHPRSLANRSTNPFTSLEVFVTGHLPRFYFSRRIVFFKFRKQSCVILFFFIVLICVRALPGFPIGLEPYSVATVLVIRLESYERKSSIEAA